MFEKYLTAQSALILVSEHEGKIVATGSIDERFEAGYGNYYWLSFGLVAPAFHKQGIGTVMLLARIALIPSGSSERAIFLSAVWRSRSFYEQFGFEHVFSDPKDQPPVAGIFRTHVDQKQIDTARAYLTELDVAFHPECFSIPFKSIESEKQESA